MKRSVYVVFSIFTFIQGSALALANGVGNGGDRISTEFIAQAWQVLDVLDLAENRGKLLTAAQMRSLAGAVRTTRVETKDTRLIERNGMVVDARVIDDPVYPGKKLIQLYRPRWEIYLQKYANVYRLIFHEYLWVIGIDDSSNRISARLKIPGTLQNQGKPMEQLPGGIYQGKGTFRGPDGEEEHYQVSLTVRDNTLFETATEIPKEHMPPHLRMVYHFHENGFFEVSDHLTPFTYGQGFCNNHQCMAVIESPELIMETITFKKGYVYRQGYVYEGEIQYSWDEKMMLVSE